MLCVPDLVLLFPCSLARLGYSMDWFPKRSSVWPTSGFRRDLNPHRVLDSLFDLYKWGVTYIGRRNSEAAPGQEQCASISSEGVLNVRICADGKSRADTDTVALDIGRSGAKSYEVEDDGQDAGRCDDLSCAIHANPFHSTVRGMQLNVGERIGGTILLAFSGQSNSRSTAARLPVTLAGKILTPSLAGIRSTSLLDGISAGRSGNVPSTQRSDPGKAKNTKTST
ncbi:hypothetical protein DFH06DRAFT_1128086 [Mycena polygramma]|nr:hypothetical protein DFH06DRAFT_1128086 [Mycena polygramma]